MSQRRDGAMTVATFVEIAKADDLQDGQMKRVELGGRELLLTRVGDAYSVLDNRCPHMGGDLSRGTLEGAIVTCPRHHSKFDVSDGRVVRWTDWTGLKLAAGKLLKSPRPAKTYEVKREGDSISVRIE
jgi:3-phenylpropionate/trans-cinnamate dioxygenase ferredoxin subunit